MFQCLPRTLAKRALFQIILICGVMFGPYANVSALELFDGACSTGCPCDAENEVEHDDPCGAEDGERGEAHGEPAADCDNDCSDCACDVGIATAVVPLVLEGNIARIPDARRAALLAAPPDARMPNIFTPPRR